MSLIFGVNLCDRIYLSTDVRLTLRGGNNIEKYKDKLIKIVPISKDISVAAAGNAKMASFLVKRFKKSKISTLDIRTARKSIKDVICPLADEYWKNSDSTASVCFIFGGLNRNSKKDLTDIDLYSRVMEFKSFDKDNVSMNLKPALFNVLMLRSNKPLRYSEPIDSHIFAVGLTPPNGYKEEDASWGEYLVFGPNGICKDTIPKIMLGRLEFAVKSKNEFGQDQALITALIKDIAEKRDEKTIGGPIFTVLLSEYVQGVITGQIGKVDTKTGVWELVSEIVSDGVGTFYSKDKNGTLRKLTLLDEYKDFGSLQL